MKDKGNGLGKALMALAIVAFVAIVAITVLAIRKLGAGYHAALEMQPAGGSSVELGYDDHLYAVIGQGMEFASDDPAPQQTLAAFLESTLRAIELRIMTAGLLYAVVVSVPMALFFSRVQPDDPTSSARLTALAGLLAFVLFVAAAVAACKAFDVPFYLPRGIEILAIAAGALGVVVGSMVMGLIVDKIRFKAVVAIIAIPVAIALFLAGIVTEIFAFSEPYINSFEYVAQIDSRILDENFDGAYYDSEKNVLVVDGTEYAPEQLPNPDHATGGALAGCIAFELLSPYSGCAHGFARDSISHSRLITIAYLLRNGLVLLFLGTFVLPRIESGGGKSASHSSGSDNGTLKRDQIAKHMRQ